MLYYSDYFTKILFLIVTSFFCIPIYSQNKNKSINYYTINGKINGLNSGSIYLIKYNNKNERLIDSSKIFNNTFKLKGAINGYNQKVYIKLNKNERDNADSINAVKIEIDNSKMQLELSLGNFSAYKLSGCSSCDQLRYFNNKNIKFYKAIDSLDELIERNEDKEKELLITKIDSCEKLIETNSIKYITQNKNSNLAPFLLYNLNITNNKFFRELFFNLSKNQQYSYYGLMAMEKLKLLDSVENQIGKIAQNFIGLDINNKELNLYKIVNKNKVVLLVFWASWCVPCREENKQLLEMYKKYKNQGFEIIAISIDKKKGDWEQAIAKDNILLWHNILESEIHFNQTNDNGYFIEYLPTKFLITTNGKIIGRYTGIENLEINKLLKEMLFVQNEK